MVERFIKKLEVGGVVRDRLIVPSPSNASSCCVIAAIVGVSGRERDPFRTRADSSGELGLDEEEDMVTPTD